MAIFALIAGMIMTQTAAPAITVEAESDRIDVAYQELSEGRTGDAVTKLHGGSAVREDDPSALINLGTAYARLGETGKARAMYRSAIISRVRYDLQLADGTWLDSRRAARLAGQRLGSTRLLVVR